MYFLFFFKVSSIEILPPEISWLRVKNGSRSVILAWQDNPRVRIITPWPPTPTSRSSGWPWSPWCRGSSMGPRMYGALASLFGKCSLLESHLILRVVKTTSELNRVRRSWRSKWIHGFRNWTRVSGFWNRKLAPPGFIVTSCFAAGSTILTSGRISCFYSVFWNKLKKKWHNLRGNVNTVVQIGQSSSLKCPGWRLCGIGNLVYSLHKNVKMKIFGSRLFATEGKMSFSQGILTGKSNFSIINEKNL